MELAVGAIVEGKVTGITKFGAFVALEGGRTGMVHISEIAHAYVSDINEYLTIGQDVKVKVIAIDPAGKINLSIKKTTEAPARGARQDSRSRQDRNTTGTRDNTQRRSGSYESRRQTGTRTAAPKEPQSFDDMLAFHGLVKVKSRLSLGYVYLVFDVFDEYLFKIEYLGFAVDERQKRNAVARLKLSVLI